MNLLIFLGKINLLWPTVTQIKPLNRSYSILPLQVALEVDIYQLPCNTENTASSINLQLATQQSINNKEDTQQNFITSQCVALAACEGK